MNDKPGPRKSKAVKKPLGARIARKVERTLVELSATRRKFLRVWPSIEPIEGYLDSPGQEEWLFQTALALPDPAVIVEIGSFMGRSTVCLAYGCRGTGKRIYSIDTFAGNDSDFQDGSEFQRGPYFEKFWDNLTQRGLADFVTPLVGLSSTIAPIWRKPIDLLFIDGSHEYPDVLEDFQNYFPHVRRGGIVAFHDIEPAWTGPWKVWQETAAPLLIDCGAVSTIAYGKKP